MSRLRVLIVDDSRLCRSMLRHILEADGDIEVAGEASDAAGAQRSSAALLPDLITMDIQMPGTTGLRAIERIMARHPTPILVVTGQPMGPAGELVFEAVRRGALDLVAKPTVSDGAAGARLREHVRRLARISVVRHVAGLRTLPPESRPQEPAAMRALGRIATVGIGASAGGPAAVAALLGALPRTFRGCVALVQHIPSGFADSFARFLQAGTPLRVEVVRTRAPAAPGCVLIPADDRHLVAAAEGGFRALDAPPAEGYRPAVNVLFRSLAQVFGSAAAGVILSGIGSDGASGLKAMHDAGALTIAQDETTSAVYGMPQAALRAGGVKRVLPLGDIAPLLLRMVGAEESR